MVPEQRDVVFTFSTEQWADAVAREFCRPPDRMAQAVLTSPRVRRALVVEPWRSAPVALARRAARRGRVVPPPGAPLVQPHRLARRDPVGVPALRRAYAAYGRRVRRAAAAEGLRQPAVLTCHPFVAAWAGLDDGGPVTYFARDDWAAYPPHERWWPAYRTAYRDLSDRGVRVAAVSPELLDRVGPRAAGIVVPNAVDAELWRTPGPAPAAVAALPSPRYAYAGTLDDRLDVEAVRALAGSLEEGVVVLVGPVPRPEDLAALRGLDRVHVLPPMGQAELVAALAAADVALIPHRVTPLTRAMSPLKLYEYLAAGLPVATVDVVPATPFEDRLVRYAGADGLPGAARRALALGRAPDDERRAALRGNSWADRQEAVLDLVLAP